MVVALVYSLALTPQSFHIVVGMFWEVDKTGMGANGDQFTGSEQLLGIDGIILTLHIDVTVDGSSSIQNCLFFAGYLLQMVQDFIIQ